tara:strand:- start:92 stop:481 length:390 start_codon:yes stop_codon:yes gene_type:complete
MKFNFLNSEIRMFDLLNQANLLLTRINEDDEIDIPKVKSLLKKEHLTFKQYLCDVFESNLLIGKKIAEYKEAGFEMDSYFEQKYVSASDHVFSLFSLMRYEDRIDIENLIIDFYVPTSGSGERFPKPLT